MHDFWPYFLELRGWYCLSRRSERDSSQKLYTSDVRLETVIKALLSTCDEEASYHVLEGLLMGTCKAPVIHNVARNSRIVLEYVLVSSLSAHLFCYHSTASITTAPAVFENRCGHTVIRLLSPY